MKKTEVLKHAIGLLVMYKMTRILVETLIGDSIKSVMKRLICKLCCRKRSQHAAKCWVTENFRRDPKVHWFPDCKVQKKIKITMREHDICSYCVKKRREQVNSLLSWEANEI